MTPNDNDDRYRQHEAILRQDVAGTVVLLNMESGRYYSLNEVGARAFELCDGTRTMCDIAAIIAGEYDAPEPVIRADVLNLLRELRDESLLVQVQPAA
jgi:hypothetical protein